MTAFWGTVKRVLSWLYVHRIAMVPVFCLVMVAVLPHRPAFTMLTGMFATGLIWSTIHAMYSLSIAKYDAVLTGNSNRPMSRAIFDKLCAGIKAVEVDTGIQVSVRGFYVGGEKITVADDR